jgi:hypothetical protein
VKKIRSTNFTLLLKFIIGCLIFNSIANSKDILIAHKKIGNYQISIFNDQEKSFRYVNIKKEKMILFHEEGFGEYFYLGNNFDDSLNGKDIYSGRSLNNNGIPNLVISHWTGGSHCCHFLYVFELGKDFKIIGKIDVGSSDIKLKDIDHDNIPEIIFWDGSIDYQFASFASSPKGKVILKFQNGKYELATHLMRKPLPKLSALKAMNKNSIYEFDDKKNITELPFSLLEAMMNLSYSGHFNEALKFADDVWPKNKDGLEKFKKEFSSALNESKYWKNF